MEEHLFLIMEALFHVTISGTKELIRMYIYPCVCMYKYTHINTHTCINIYIFIVIYLYKYQATSPFYVQEAISRSSKKVLPVLF